MQQDERFIARILDVSANAVASSAASALLESVSGEAAKSAGNFGAWRSFAMQTIGDLVAALRVADPAVFRASIRWQSVAFRARETPEDLLRPALASLRDAAAEAIASDATSLIDPYFDGAIESLSGGADGMTRIDGSTENGRLALEYMHSAISGDRHAALDRIEQAADAGMSNADLYESVLLPAMVEVGAMWHTREVSIAEEHVLSDTTRQAMAMLSRRVEHASAPAHTAIVASVQGNAHELGARAAADFFEMAGWRAVCLGADVPPEDLVRAVAFFHAHLVGLSVTTTKQLEAARVAIELLREHSAETKILVGGAAFTVAPDLWRKIGADQVSLSLREAPGVAQSLVV